MNKKVLLFTNDDWSFVNFRWDLACALQKLGYQVFVLAKSTTHQKKIEAAGFKFLSVSLERGRLNPWREGLTLWSVIKIYRQVAPDICHHFAIKPIIYGSIAAFFAKTKKIVNTITGLGSVFVGKEWKARIWKRGVLWVYRAIFNRENAWTIVQNHDDYEYFVAQAISPKRMRIILGSGVNLQQYPQQPLPSPPLVVAMVARLIKQKGIQDYVEAAKQVRQKKPEVRFVLVGDIDKQNPSAISDTELARWKEENHVEFLGHLNRVIDVWKQAHVAVLTTINREGLPKALLEAAALGRALIATDIPGNRELVRQGENGFLIPAQDPSALSSAILELAEDSALLECFAKAARSDVEQFFSSDVVNQQIVTLYQI